MQLPKMFQGESLTRLMQGAFAGFLATVIIGFGWGGWMLGSTAKKMAEIDSRDEHAVDGGLDIAALPIFGIARQPSSRDDRLTIPT